MYGFKEVLEEFFKGLTEEQKSSIKLVSGDGARWIESTVHKFCPKAIFGIDPFHVVSWCTEVLDAVRKEEWNNARDELRKAKPKGKGKKGRPKGGKKEKTKLELRVEAVRSTKYPLLMNPEKLSETYRGKLQQRTLFFQPSGMVFPTQELKRPTTKSSCLSEWLMVFAILKTSSR